MDPKFIIQIANLCKQAAACPVPAAPLEQELRQLTARLEKHAGLGSAVGSALKFVPRMLAKTVTKPGLGMLGRGGFSAGRAATTGAALGGLGLLGAHAHEAAKSQMGPGSNPFTWSMSGTHPTAENVFTNNKQQLDAMSGGWKAKLDAATRSGDSATVDKLNQQFSAGDVEGHGGWWDRNLGETGRAIENFGTKATRGFGLSPGEQAPSVYMKRMADAQRHAQEHYQGLVSQYAVQPGDRDRLGELQTKLREQQTTMLPQQRDQMNNEITQIRKRLALPAGVEGDAASTVRKRFEAAGMQVRPGRQPWQDEPQQLMPPSAGVMHGYGGYSGDARTPMNDNPYDRWLQNAQEENRLQRSRYGLPDEDAEPISAIRARLQGGYR